MSTQNTGGPAFPALLDDGYGNKFANEGMTLRDYFAAKAMHAILSDPDFSAGDSKLAGYAYNVADAMLKAREE